MALKNQVLTLVYRNNKEENQVLLSELTAAFTRYLEHLGVRPLIKPVVAVTGLLKTTDFALT